MLYPYSSLKTYTEDFYRKTIQNIVPLNKNDRFQSKTDRHTQIITATAAYEIVAKKRSLITLLTSFHKLLSSLIPTFIPIRY